MFDVITSDQQPRIDRLQLAALCGLMLLGAAFVYSATMASGSSSMVPLYNQMWFRQIIWYLLGVGAAAALCLVDYRVMARWSFVIYWLTILLLVLVLIPGIGSMRFNARRWFDLRFFQLQPSEFAKLAFILAQAHFLSRPAEELRGPRLLSESPWPDVAAVRIDHERTRPRLGAGAVAHRAGNAVRRRSTQALPFRLMAGVGILAGVFLADILFTPPGWWQIKLEDYQRQRLMVYFGADFAPANASPEEKARARRLQVEKSYQVRQALISVGSGGLLGQRLAPRGSKSPCSFCRRERRIMISFSP